MPKTMIFATLLFCFSAPIFSFDPMQMAQHEANTWHAYYYQNTEEALQNLTDILGYQFEIKDPAIAKQVTYKFALALIAFEKMPSNSSAESYNRYVLPFVTDAYLSLQHAIGASWNYEEASKADLDWWIARRNPSSNHPIIVGKKMEHLFDVLFGKNDGGHFARAAYLRAVAALYRDICQSMPNGITKEDWANIVSILEKAYIELKQGIAANQKNSTF